MKIIDVKINHVREPLGFRMDGPPVVGYKVVEALGSRQKSVRICVFADEGEESLLYDSGDMSETLPVYPLAVMLAPRTRYVVRLEVVSDKDEVATARTWFETGKMDEAWQAEWIGATDVEDNSVPVLGKGFVLEKEVKSARLYVGCAGLFALQLNGEKVGREYLTPYCNDYSKWMQAITYDVTKQLVEGKNLLEASLAEGWYKGRFALADEANIYGDTLGLIAELRVQYAGGRTELIKSDDSWFCRRSQYVSAGIYDGVEIDYKRSAGAKADAAVLPLDKGKLTDRMSLPVVVKDMLPVEKVFTTPKGEACIDMGQNMVGWLRIDTEKFADKDFNIRFFEVLDPQGNVYLDNLRSAKQAFIYKTDGKARVVEPEFTFYGFRYAWIEGLEKIVPEAFAGCVVYSDMEQTGEICTSDPMVNRLFLNALWGQRGNFVDVPTDCPQRDERLGWTGDAQVFCGTANFNMDASAFFAKYMEDVWQEQQARGGAVPHFVPSFGDGDNGAHSESSAAWGDVATIVPWTTYLFSGDKTLLARQYPAMKAWIDYIKKQDSGSYLWDSGFHFGDWLALDTPRPERPLGTTPNALVASAYYLYSAELASKAAGVLGKTEEQEEYKELAGNIRKALQKEFVTPSGRIASDTQTANVLALFMDFATNKARAAADLNKKVLANDGHLNTGFVGTAYLCRVLSDNGYNDAAWNLLLNREYPGWLYEVKMGATTIWERWNSIKPDGTLGEVGMNSYNHYAYGAVVEWMYRNAVGIRPREDGAGFARVCFAPQPSHRLEWMKASYDSAFGVYRCEWQILEDKLCFVFEVPFGGEAELVLPDAPGQIVLNGKLTECTAGMVLEKGVYEIEYVPTQPYYIYYGPDAPAVEVMGSGKMVAWLRKNAPGFAALPHYVFFEAPQGTLRDYLKEFGVVFDEKTEQRMKTDWAGIRSWDLADGSL